MLGSNVKHIHIPLRFSDNKIPYTFFAPHLLERKTPDSKFNPTYEVGAESRSFDTKDPIKSHKVVGRTSGEQWCEKDVSIVRKRI